MADDTIDDEDPSVFDQISQQRAEKEEDRRQEHIADIARRLAKRTGFLAAAREFIKEQPIYYDKSRIWWLWNHQNTRWEITDETDVLTIITMWGNLYGDATVKSRNQLVEALRQEGRKTKPKDFPKTWVQFKDRVYDLDSGDTYPATSEYFCVNPIPWKIGTTEDCPTISKLFDEWVGPEYTQTLYEIIAYHCYADYPIHVLFCLVGNGRNGKSKFQELIHRFIGSQNICSTELENIFENRFETFKLYKKLGCEMGETNFNVMRNTSLLKKLVGQSLIGFEAKNKDPFDDYNYAKIVISSNSLPTSDDTSDGFYRRWLIINFPHEFPEGRNILDGIPVYEYENLARKVTKILPELLRLGRFRNQGTIEERKQRYIEASNPLMIFLKDHCVMGNENEYVLYSTLYTRYAAWLNDRKMRVISRKEFSQMLERENYETRNTTIKNQFGEFERGRYIFGIRFKQGLIDFEANRPSTRDTRVTDQIPLSPIRAITDLENTCNARNESRRAINASGTAEVPDFPTPNDILEAIRSFAGPVLVEDLARLFPGEVRLDGWLAELLAAGEIFSPKSGVVMILQ